MVAVLLVPALIVSLWVNVTGGLILATHRKSLEMQAADKAKAAAVIVRAPGQVVAAK